MSGRGLCDELIIRPEESYRLLCAVVCDLETSRRPWPALGRSATAKNKAGDKSVSCVTFYCPWNSSRMRCPRIRERMYFKLLEKTFTACCDSL